MKRSSFLRTIRQTLGIRRRVRSHSAQFGRFLLCGGTGFVVDLSSLIVMVERLSIDPRIAVLLSSCAGALFVFIANKFFTFRNRDPAARQFARFALVYGMSIVMNALISNALLWLGIVYILAKMIAIGIGILWNYSWSHLFIFRKVSNEEVVIV